MINGLGLYGVIGVVGGIRIHQPAAASRRGGSWPVGLLLFLMGDVYTYSYPKLFHADVPFPSPGDAMYIGVYPVLMVGLLLLVRRRNQRADGPGVIDAVIMSVGPQPRLVPLPHRPVHPRRHDGPAPQAGVDRLPDR